MMAAAGFEVWFVPEIEGSYEEIPANIIAFLVRERRWVQGNLQHIQFLLLSGLRAIHRETLLTGSMGYFAAPLWAMFLIVFAYGMVSCLERGILAILSPAASACVAGRTKNEVHFMVKDSIRYASTGGWGFAQFNDGTPADEAVQKTCFPYDRTVKVRDFVFNRYAP